MLTHGSMETRDKCNLIGNRRMGWSACLLPTLSRCDGPSTPDIASPPPHYTLELGLPYVITVHVFIGHKFGLSCYLSILGPGHPSLPHFSFLSWSFWKQKRYKFDASLWNTLLPPFMLQHSPVPRFFVYQVERRRRGQIMKSLALCSPLRKDICSGLEASGDFVNKAPDILTGEVFLVMVGNCLKTIT